MGLLKHAIAAAALASAFIAGAAPASAATAPERSVTDHAEVSFWSSHDVAAPGETVTLILHQELAPGWHTYWRNPGDSGLETEIALTLPLGVEAGPILWPAPERLPLPPLVSYGYKTEAILRTELTIPEDWPAGAPIDIAAAATWLVCEDTTCIPEAADFTLSLPTAAAGFQDPFALELAARAAAAMPTPLGAAAEAAEIGDTLRVVIRAPDLADIGVTEQYFFPHRAGATVPSAPQRAFPVEGGLAIEAPRGYLEALGDGVSGVVSVVRAGADGAQTRSVYDFAAPFTAAAASAAPIGAAALVGGEAGGDAGSGGGGLGSAPATLGLGLGPSLAAAALLAFLGGLILNLMPCVFPVLALKALSLAKGAGSDGSEQRRHGLLYGAGVLGSFLALGGALVALKSAGVATGWGFQLQSPLVVAILAYVLFAVALNLSGVFEFGGQLMGAGGRLASRGGDTGAFFTGVLAVIVAAPCTAPFMGAALGYAMLQDAATALTVFAALGLGFAAPLVLLSFSPRLAAMLPRPGAWMARFRQALAFPMYAAAAWLVWVLGAQAGVDALFAVLIGMVLLALAGWSLGAGFPASTWGRRAAALAAALALVGAAAALSPAASGGAPGSGSARAENAQAFTTDALAQLRDGGQGVFLNVTADWCISCKVNERVVLASDAFSAALAERDIVYLMADWTRPNDEITDLLQDFGRAGIPLYVYYPATGADPILLPQLLTMGIVEDALEAGAAGG